jgi:hypothetical protein
VASAFEGKTVSSFLMIGMNVSLYCVLLLLDLVDGVDFASFLKNLLKVYNEKLLVTCNENISRSDHLFVPLI